MASTLASISMRVSQTLLDTGNMIWPAASITEGIRSALGEYNLAAKIDDASAVVVTLNGLDDALVTTLPAIHDTVIVWGAAAYCGEARAIDRADSPELGTEAAQLKAWADGRMREFKAMLGALFPQYLAVAVNSGSTGSSDPARMAAEIALMASQAGLASAQADKATSEAAHLDGQESREAAAAIQAAQDRISEAARLADLRNAVNSSWASWTDDGSKEFEGGKPE